MGRIDHFYELPVYKVCRSFRKKISEIVREKFPRNEKFLLGSQILRASRSVTANIVEGFGRFHFQENIQFCRQSRGSLDETLEHLITAYDESYISAELLKEVNKEYDECLRQLNGYIKYLKMAKRGS